MGPGAGLEAEMVQNGGRGGGRQSGARGWPPTTFDPVTGTRFVAKTASLT